MKNIVIESSRNQGRLEQNFLCVVIEQEENSLLREKQPKKGSLLREHPEKGSYKLCAAVCIEPKQTMIHFFTVLLLYMQQIRLIFYKY